MTNYFISSLLPYQTSLYTPNTKTIFAKNLQNHLTNPTKSSSIDNTIVQICILKPTNKKRINKCCAFQNQSHNLF